MMQVGDFNSLEDWVSYLVNLKIQLETLSSTHITWWTHKNPYGCWICDLILLVNKWEDIYYPTKSIKNDLIKDKVSKPKKSGAIK